MSSERNSVFISYSHHDSGYLSRLQVHLRPMLRYGGIDIWDDTRISPGSNWRNEIKTAIERAKVAILLVSADFLASDFIVEKELPLLLKKANEGGTVILMVIIGHCRFQQFDELSKFQAVNNPTRPLSVLPVAERERVWAQLAGNVEAALIGRDLDEAWAVTNERLVYEALEDYVKEGANGSFLIISSEDYYVQFSYDKPSNEIVCEAVSNEFLPEGSRLSSEDKSRLLSLNFREPDEIPNYYQVLIRDSSKEFLSNLSAVVVEVFTNVYHISKNSKLDFAIGLNG